MSRGTKETINPVHSICIWSLQFDPRSPTIPADLQFSCPFLPTHGRSWVFSDPNTAILDPSGADPLNPSESGVPLFRCPLTLSNYMGHRRGPMYIFWRAR